MTAAGQLVLPAAGGVLRDRDRRVPRSHSITFWLSSRAMLNDVAANDVHRVVSNVAGLYGEVLTTKSWIARTSRKSNWRGTGDGNEQGRTA